MSLLIPPAIPARPAPIRVAVRLPQGGVAPLGPGAAVAVLAVTWQEHDDGPPT
ncbi:hypothetical protein ACOACQ_07030 [Nocardioides sp. CPCC 206347]|uniref:hypothetical protein n=1 Tax=Nocardioides sp. CPCC 206347 TaxID=3406463 RepID=UPI003B439568